MKFALFTLRLTILIIAAMVYSSAIASTTTERPHNEEPEVSGASPSMRLLSQSQYKNSIAAIFGPQISSNVRFSPVQRIGGLEAIGARSIIVTIGALEPLENSARMISAQIVSEANRDLLIPCQPSAAIKRDDNCAKIFLSRAGRLLFRRHLSDVELKNVVNVAGASAEQAGDFYDGLSQALAYLLISPKFLYIQENFEADPEQLNYWHLDGYSKASRLSFFLWDAAPDSRLLDAAKRGALSTQEGLDREVKRLLASPRLEQGVRAFFEDMLIVEAFDLLTKDPIIYPAFTSQAVTDAREQMLMTISDHLIARERGYRDLFVTRNTFMSRALAVVYRVPAHVGPVDWVPFEFSENDHRGGLLTLVGFLARYSHPGRTSPTNRGRGLRETLLCQHVPDPPPNVNFELFENSTAERKTARQRLEAHSSNPICAGCHRLTDPLGLVLEKFDGAGQYRETENGAPIDTSGSVNRVPVSDAIELGETLHDDPALTSCLVSRVYSYGTGRELSNDDGQLLDYFDREFENSDYRFVDLLESTVTSDAFFKVEVDDDLLAMENRNDYQD